MDCGDARIPEIRALGARYDGKDANTNYLLSKH